MNLENKTIREIALAMPATTRVFEELKIDYCCGGNKSFREACEIANISPDAVEEKIASALNDLNTEFNADLDEQLSPAKLIDLIVEKHHVFTKNEIERLTPLLSKVVFKHGDRHPSLNKLHPVFEQLSNDLLPHMEKEEFILFPFIKNLEASSISGLPVPGSPFGSVENPIQMMSIEHDEAGRILKEIRSITNDFSVPQDACPSFQALYFGLEELEKDLHRHIHLENNLLFPMAIEIEQAGLEAAA